MPQPLLLTIPEVHKMQMEALEKQDAEKLQVAENYWRAMLTQDPENWAIQFFLGTILMHKGDTGVAIALFRSAATLKPDAHEIWNNLGTAYRKEHINDKAEQALLKALELSSTQLGFEDPDILNNLGTMHINEGTPEKGLDYFKRAIKAKPDHANAQWNYGLALLETEQWEEGFKKYAWGITSKDRLIKNYKQATWWNGTYDKNKTLVVYGEQGIGDEIMFASMIHELIPRFKKIVFDCHPRLINLFKRNFPEVDCYPTRKGDDMPWLDNYDRLDYKIPIGNLGKFLRKKESDFPQTPYLIPNRELVDEYKNWFDILGGEQLMGISWIGGHKRTRKDLRAIPLENWKPVFDAFPNATWVSLQYTDNLWEVKQIKEKFGVTIHHFPEVLESKKWERWIVDDKEFNDKYEAKGYAKYRNLGPKDIQYFNGPGFDYDETAAFLYALYEKNAKIISVNTSLVHLGGSMGVPMYVLTPSRPAWRYGLKRKNMVWYGDIIQQYRQNEDDWTPAFNQLLSDLQDMKEAANG